MEVKLEDQKKRRRRKKMAKSRTYYCQTCQKSITFQSNDIMKCDKCSSLFGNAKRNPFEINMRNTWSGQTQVEFSQQTVNQSINEMNNK